MLKTIIGSLKPTSGTLHVASNVEFNYIDQERIKLDETKSVYDEIGEGYDFVKLGDEKLSIWSYLKRFLFDDDRIKTNIAQLSGGEKGRLLLAKILKNGGNFIILDEPTNDLDLQTLRLLEEALIGFKGCVLVVSHDRYFLNRVCTGILAFEDDGKIIYHVGDYNYYYEKRLKHLKAIKDTVRKEKNTENTTKKNKPASKIRKLKWKEERELETIEEHILEIEEKIERIESIFVSPDFFEKYGEKATELQSELDKIKIWWILCINAGKNWKILKMVWMHSSTPFEVVFFIICYHGVHPWLLNSSVRDVLLKMYFYPGGILYK